MKGDFSRFTFDPKKHYSRVLMQQGRVQLDADWNEQVAALLYRLETLTADLTGPSGGGPQLDCGFQISTDNDGDLKEFKIGKGRYYVGGLLCENEKDTTYQTQPFAPADSETFTRGLVYLDAWEETVNAIEDSNIRETALGGVDTAARAEIVWRVCTLPFSETKLVNSALDAKPESIIEHWPDFTNMLQPSDRGLLSVRLKPPDTGDTGPCIVPPSARYRGTENQLYRIEIYTGEKEGKPTSFKWSRDNGSVIFPVTFAEGKIITLERQAYDRTLSLKLDDWVELIDDEYIGLKGTGKMFQVKSAPANMQVVVEPDVPKTKRPTTSNTQGRTGRTYLRRWDGAAAVVDTDWHPLEDGIEIQFESATDSYRTGDYWHFPVRTGNNVEISLLHKAPDGVNHRYAPLAVYAVKDRKFTVEPCLRTFNQLVALKK